MQYNDIYSFISAEEENFKLSIDIMEGYSWSFYEHVRTTVLYKNSTYKSGKDDSKPYKNIILPILNLAYRAEGFDVKDIVLFINDKYNYFKSFLIKKFHDKWARENNIDTFIDDMVESYVDFGGALVKDVNDVKPEVVPLQRIAFVDQTDILSGPICEKHFYAPDQLKEMEKKGWKNVDEVIILSRKENDTKDAVGSNTKAKTPGKYIEVYEIHGMFPRYWLYDHDNQGNYTGQFYAEDSKDMEYVRQLHICCFYQSAVGKQGITLYKGIEKELPYKLILRDGRYGRALGMGGAEELFEAQVWVNYDEIHKKNMLDAASKVILQTTDPAFANRNKIQSMENLEITVTEPNTRIEQIQTTPVNLALFENSTERWEEHARQMGAATEAVLGEAPTAGTPFKLQDLLTQQGLSLHEYRKGKLATFLGEIYRDWILPYISSEITKGQEFLAELDLDELHQIADKLVECETNDMIKEKILNGETIDSQAIDQFKQQVRDSFMKKGNKHFIEIFKGEMKDVQMDIEIDIAGKQKNLAAEVEALTKIFQQIIANPSILDDPRLAKIFNQIIEASGLSPIDFYSPPQSPQQGKAQNRILESINFKDLPPDAQAQLAAQAGIKITPQAPPQLPQNVAQPAMAIK